MNRDPVWDRHHAQLLTVVGSKRRAEISSASFPDSSLREEEGREGRLQSQVGYMLDLSLEGFASFKQNHCKFIGFSCESLHSNSQFTSPATTRDNLLRDISLVFCVVVWC